MINMTYDEFRLKHSDLISFFQFIESDLRLIYAGMLKGDFKDNLDLLNKSNLGEIINQIRILDNSDGNKELNDDDYKLLNQIRKKRNYWCHQCYLDFLYIQDRSEQMNKFNEIALLLDKDYEKISKLYKSIQKFRLIKLKQYKRI